MKNTNSNNNKFHQRRQHLLNLTFSYKLTIPFVVANYVFARHNWS